MTAANELAPCKHCGSPVEIHVGHQELVFFYCTNDDCYAITSFRATPELGKRKAIERWNRRAQTAEGVDEAAAALKELLDAIDARYVAETERKRANAISPRMEEAIAKARELLARARGGMDESEAVTLLREVYDHGENFELHERIRVFLGIKD